LKLPVVLRISDVVSFLIWWNHHDPHILSLFLSKVKQINPNYTDAQEIAEFVAKKIQNIPFTLNQPESSHQKQRQTLREVSRQQAGQEQSQQSSRSTSLKLVRPDNFGEIDPRVQPSRQSSGTFDNVESETGSQTTNSSFFFDPALPIQSYHNQTHNIVSFHPLQQSNTIDDSFHHRSFSSQQLSSSQHSYRSRAHSRSNSLSGEYPQEQGMGAHSSKLRSRSQNGSHEDSMPHEDDFPERRRFERSRGRNHLRESEVDKPDDLNMDHDDEDDSKDDKESSNKQYREDSFEAQKKRSQKHRASRNSSSSISKPKSGLKPAPNLNSYVISEIVRQRLEPQKGRGLTMRELDDADVRTRYLPLSDALQTHDENLETPIFARPIHSVRGSLQSSRENDAGKSESHLDSHPHNCTEDSRNHAYVFTSSIADLSVIPAPPLFSSHNAVMDDHIGSDKQRHVSSTSRLLPRGHTRSKIRSTEEDVINISDDNGSSMAANYGKQEAHPTPISLKHLKSDAPAFANIHINIEPHQSKLRGVNSQFQFHQTCDPLRVTIFGLPVNISSAQPSQSSLSPTNLTSGEVKATSVNLNYPTREVLLQLENTIRTSGIAPVVAIIPGGHNWAVVTLGTTKAAEKLLRLSGKLTMGPHVLGTFPFLPSHLPTSTAALATSTTSSSFTSNPIALPETHRNRISTSTLDLPTKTVPLIVSQFNTGFAANPHFGLDPQSHSSDQYGPGVMQLKSSISPIHEGFVSEKRGFNRSDPLNQMHISRLLQSKLQSQSAQSETTKRQRLSPKSSSSYFFPFSYANEHSCDHAMSDNRMDGEEEMLPKLSCFEKVLQFVLQM